MYDTALYIGRFEPPHAGHMALLQRALDSAPQAIVVMGSAWQVRSPKNPFTWPEREAMLRAALSADDNARLQVLVCATTTTKPSGCRRCAAQSPSARRPVRASRWSATSKTLPAAI